LIIAAWAMRTIFGGSQGAYFAFGTPLSALSQMWIFALYEFLRTWRQRAEQLSDQMVREGMGPSNC
jgi:hypothetical protein